MKRLVRTVPYRPEPERKDLIGHHTTQDNNTRCGMANTVFCVPHDCSRTRPGREQETLCFVSTGKIRVAICRYGRIRFWGSISMSVKRGRTELVLVGSYQKSGRITGEVCWHYDHDFNRRFAPGIWRRHASFAMMPPNYSMNCHQMLT